MEPIVLSKEAFQTDTRGVDGLFLTGTRNTRSSFTGSSNNSQLTL